MGFYKRGVEEEDPSLEKAIIRELEEETGMKSFFVKKELEERISFKFPQHVAERVGFHSQETTMFLVEYIGENKDWRPQDDEISEIGYFKKEEVLRKLAHEETRKYFQKHCL